MKDIRSLAKGDIVCLKDEQTLEDLASQENYISSLDLSVREVLTIVEANDTCSWSRIEFDDSDIILIIKQVGDEFDVRVCFAPDSYDPGDRKDLQNSGWFESLFDPINEEISLSQCEFQRSLVVSYDDIGDIEYNIKGGVLYGEDTDRRFCSVVEWSSIQDCPNPEIIAIEIGGEEADHGGYIVLYQGVNINPEEYDVL